MAAYISACMAAYIAAHTIVARKDLHMATYRAEKITGPHTGLAAYVHDCTHMATDMASHMAAYTSVYAWLHT